MNIEALSAVEIQRDLLAVAHVDLVVEYLYVLLAYARNARIFVVLRNSGDSEYTVVDRLLGRVARHIYLVVIDLDVFNVREHHTVVFNDHV